MVDALVIGIIKMWTCVMALLIVAIAKLNDDDDDDDDD